MWSILRSLTTNRSVTTARIVSDNDKKFVSEKQKADGLESAYRVVRNHKLEKYDGGMKKSRNSRLWS